MNNNYTPDIYKISETVNNIQKKFMSDPSEDTLSMGIFGYMNEIFSNSIQNSIIMASEWGNEAFPIRAKFEKTILTNAVTYNIKDINATPAKMTVMIGFIERELEAKMEKGTFKLYKDCKFMIGDYEFHLDYDIIINRTDLTDGTRAYSARYDIIRKNPISDILNPYLQTPIQLRVNESNFVFITCDIRQVKYETINKKIVSNSILENKTIDFEFDNQLATFDIVVKEKNKETYLTPIFEGMPINGNEKYCFYNYIDSNTIRIKFDRNSFVPKMNCDIEICLQSTSGSEGNFNYSDDIISGLNSEKINYNDLSILIRPVTSSMFGVDRKSVKDLKEIIPKEILSRGSITNAKDLENYFNNLDVNNRLYFFKRRDNQLERLKYAYMIVKDNMDNIVPTNTINMKLKKSDLTGTDERLVLKPGQVISYKNNYGVIDNDMEDILTSETKGFVYSSPFTMVINKNPLSISYYLTNIDREYEFKYSYINQNSSLQFISNYIKCDKNYLEDNNYKFNMTLTQNMNIDRNLVETLGGSSPVVTKSKIKPILVIDNNGYKYYKEGKVKYYHKGSFSYDIEFELETDGNITPKNRIKIDNIKPEGNDIGTSIYLPERVNMSIYIYIETNKEIINEINNIKPNVNNWQLVNRYDFNDKMSLFHNYSHIINSKVKVYKNSENEQMYDIIGVPVVRYSYINDIDRCKEFIDYIQFRKVYIDNALKAIENSFSVDLKFFNTYGPSKIFKIGHKGELLDRVNLTFNFQVKLYVGADKHAKDYIKREIKEYVENINEIKNIHMSNLITDLSNKFKSDIEYIEFIGINNYNSLYQYLEKGELDELEDVPEFLNVNLSKDLNPDINIMLM